jgi:NADPH-dependent curcumin reductase
MPSANRQFILHSRPRGLLGPNDLQLIQTPMPTPGEGQALARVKYLSIDPTMRVWMTERDTYLPAVKLGEVMRCIGLAEIVESKTRAFRKGDKVNGLVGMQEYVVLDPRDPVQFFQKIPAVPFVSETAFLGLLGTTGLTAYFGMMDIARPEKDETLVVSAAAGATGSIAGQIGKIHGCRVIGIAGGETKCKWLTDELGFDVAIDYKQADWKEKLAAATPKGIDIDFENVGGDIMHSVLERMNLHGRVVLCGMISGYTKEDAGLESFFTILVKRLRVQGFIILDYAPKFTKAVMQLGKWKMLRKLKDRETVVQGLEKAPDAINMLFTGGNIGKLIVKV